MGWVSLAWGLVGVWNGKRSGLGGLSLENTKSLLSFFFLGGGAGWRIRKESLVFVLRLLRFAHLFFGRGWGKAFFLVVIKMLLNPSFHSLIL